MMQGGVNHGTLPSHNTHNKSPGGSIFHFSKKIIKKFFFAKPTTRSLLYIYITSILFFYFV